LLCIAAKGERVGCGFAGLGDFLALTIAAGQLIGGTLLCFFRLGSSVGTGLLVENVLLRWGGQGFGRCIFLLVG